jgi:antitoxin component YwqK of YwqJK toxin-antitoxin module
MIDFKKVFFLLIFLVCYCVSGAVFGQEINKFNKNKERIGAWKKYHPNKRIRYTGQFKNGKEMGIFKFYDITSSKFPVIIKTFYNNSDSVFAQFFTIQGKIKTEGFLKDKDRVGVWKYFNKNGEIMSKEIYEDGVLHGEQFVYYPDGKITAVSHYIKGILEGVSSKYSSKGILIEEITYANNSPNGLAKYFELNGDLKETGFYKNGKREGKWEYYLDGELAPEQNERRRLKEGFKNK